jgi:hypothetical protein
MSDPRKTYDEPLDELIDLDPDDYEDPTDELIDLERRDDYNEESDA